LLKLTVELVYTPDGWVWFFAATVTVA